MTALGEMVAASGRLTAAAPDAFPATVPRPGATVESRAAAARRLGRPLDVQHDALLAVTDGWEHAFLGGTLLGTGELGRGMLWAEAQASLDAFYREGDSRRWPPRAELVPIHASPFDTDVMTLWLGGPVTDGGHPVLLFAGAIVDRWPTLQAWWSRMLELQALSLRHVLDLTGRTTSRPTRST
jgi:hypothetical protein